MKFFREMNRLKAVRLVIMAVIFLLVISSFASVNADAVDVEEENFSNESKNDDKDGSFKIEQMIDGEWVLVHSDSFGIEYETKKFTILPRGDELKIRIVQNNGEPFSDIEQVKLQLFGFDIPATYAKYVDTGESVLADISYDDNDVVIVHDKAIEIKWEFPFPVFIPLTLSLTANEYPRSSSFFRFEDGYYKLGSKLKEIKVDGLLDNDLGVSQFSPYWEPGTGHPDGYTYIYISEDSENVYFSVDITGDNTDDYGEDWIEIKIKNQVFRIDDFNTEWGKMGFGMTDKVSYKHQTAEFSIPKDLIGDDDFIFDLSYYGTMAPSNEAVMVDQDGGDDYILANQTTQVQEVLITDGGADGFNLLIDSFLVTNKGTASDDQISYLLMMKDGGNGECDFGYGDDTLIGSYVSNPSLSTGQRIGVFNDDNHVLNIADGSSATVFVIVTLKPTADEDEETIMTELDGTDSDGSNWQNDGIETASSATKIFTTADFQSMHLTDNNSNGKIDEIYMNVSFPAGIADGISHRINEETTLQRFSITYDGNKVSVNSIQFVANYGDSAVFKLNLNENDEDLLFDTSTNDFSVTYDGSHGDLKIQLGTNHADVEGISGLWPETDRAKPLANLSVDTNPVYENDLDFNVSVNYSEEMDTNVIPTIQFSGNAGPTSLNTASWVTSKKWKGFYTVQDVDEFNTVSVHSSGAKDLNGNTEGPANGASFLIDTIAPSIDSITGNTAGTTGETTTIEAEFSNSYSQATIFYKPSGGSSWQSKSILSGNADISIPENSDDSWIYYVEVEDAAGNKERAPSFPNTYEITVTDNDAPVINDNSPSTFLPGQTFNFYSYVSDNVASTPSVYVNYWFDSQSHKNKSMIPKSGNLYEYQITVPNQVNSIHYYFSAKDNLDNWNENTEQTITYQESTENIPPTSNPGGPYQGSVNTSLEFDGSNSIDIDGTITDYTWNFGDGIEGYGMTTSHIYDSNGSYTVTLTVTDNNGSNNVSTTTATILGDSDGDGYNDLMEASYNTDPENSTSYPTDTDNDGTPDEPSTDGNYTGDSDDDNDGLDDETEENIGSDSKNQSDVKEIEETNGYLIDYKTDNDQNYDGYYNKTSDETYNVTLDQNESYLIDEDGDGEIDYLYDYKNDTISAYSSEEPETEKEQDDSDETEEKQDEIPLIPIVVAAVIILGLILFFVYKKGYLK